ncbi:hypothetical protein CFP65_3123 [Kitasatospora sp. MMS16-BH015]|uniref:hypothetical protein n=1 Tax=Kitasatospora sp. MMS16-BH015 TaxID=2018025 RepID=UPI000CA2E01E|nr:hypothetical protein [Kitasatospora sp. MMS16-BH015]AUG77930.1 hypothetical protein CFP65_3123 [Kitasatospora sp. MMS16-BH015]
MKFESPAKFAALTRQAALSVAVAAAIGGAVFAPSAQAMAATPTAVTAGHVTPDRCEGCHPDVI